MTNCPQGLFLCLNKKPYQGRGIEKIIFKSLLDKNDFDKMYIEIEKILSDVKQELDSQSYQNLLEFMGFPTNYDKLIQI